MVDDYAALCSDYYINQKLALRTDLPFGREVMLDLFNRVRKSYPEMQHVRRFEGELALESTDNDDSQYRWLALTNTSVRSGWVNPESVKRAMELHRMLLETAPFYLSISPLDIEHIELILGFDLHAEKDRNEIVFDALFGDSPLASMVDPGCDNEMRDERVLDAQPFLAFTLDAAEEHHAFVEVKTRPSSGELKRGRMSDVPISIYLTVRRYGPLEDLNALPGVLDLLETHVRRLADERLIPYVVVPIRRAILSPPPR